MVIFLNLLKVVNTAISAIKAVEVVKKLIMAFAAVFCCLILIKCMKEKNTHKKLPLTVFENGKKALMNKS